MPVVISSSLVLSDSGAGSADHPVIGYHNIVTASNIDATTEDADWPVTNLANPATHLRWQGTSMVADEYVTITTGTMEEVDYLAVAKHNFGTAQIAPSVEGSTDLDASPQVWTELVQDSFLDDDSPILFRWFPGIYQGIRLRMQPGDAVPRIGSLFLGRLLVLPRRIWQGHTPIKYGRQTTIVNGFSESGHYLGRIVTGELRQSETHLQLIDPDTYREDIDPFIAHAVENPFFFAWRPGTYPREVGYAVLSGDPRPVNAPQHGLTELTLPMRGVA